MDVRKAAIGTAVALVVVVATALGFSIATGTLIVGDPVAATSQVVTGTVTAPGVGVVTVDAGPTDVPRVRVTRVGDESFTVNVPIYVNNSANAVGGRASQVTYDVYAAGSPRGGFQHVGSGRIDGLSILPNATVTSDNPVDIGYDEASRALTRSALDSFVTNDDRLYIRIKGNASVSLGPFSYTVPFNQTTPVEL